MDGLGAARFVLSWYMGSAHRDARYIYRRPRHGQKSNARITDSQQSWRAEAGTVQSTAVARHRRGGGALVALLTALAHCSAFCGVMPSAPAILAPCLAPATACCGEVGSARAIRDDPLPGCARGLFEVIAST